MDTLFPVEGQLEITPKTRPLTQTASIQIYLQLAENTLFVQGFDANEYKSRPPTLLRGSLVVRILKPLKLKSISLSLKGIARTEWPEGIPPKRQENAEESTLLNHTWPFYSNGNSPGCDLFKHLPNDAADDITSLNLDVLSIRSSSTGPGSSALSVLKRVTSPSPNRGRSSSIKLFSSNSYNDHDNSDVFNFTPGDYIYNFEHPIPASTPETIEATFGSVSYELHVFIERYGAFKSNISTSLPLKIVRAPSDESVEDTEPIAISRDWEDQLHYDIVIASKSIILNAYIPVAFKLIPLDKIKLHRIRIFITENVEYYCKNKKVHRMEPTKKYLLLEHKAPPPKDLPPDADAKLKKSGNLLTSDGYDITAKEFEFQVYVPQKLNQNLTLHPNTSYTNIKSHHWIKICLRLSRVIDGKPKHYEISIDSPIHVLNPLCSHANTLLPAYGIPNFDSIHQNHESNIYFPKDVINSPELSPNVIPVDNYNSISNVLKHSNSTSSLNHHLQNFESTVSANIYKPDNLQPQLTSPQAIPVSPIVSPIQRPIHLIRRPSFDPPAFDDDISPPPLTRIPKPNPNLPTNNNNPVGIDNALYDDFPQDRSNSYTPLNSPPPPTNRNGFKDEDIPMDPPTYDDFLEADGMMSPFLRKLNSDNRNIPEILLSKENEEDSGDLSTGFKFKGGSTSMPASVLRSTSPVGQRLREKARTPRASLDNNRSAETIGVNSSDSNLQSIESSIGLSIASNNHNEDTIEPYSPDREAANNETCTRFSSRSSVSPKDLIPTDINDNDFLFEPLLHSNSTQVSISQPEHYVFRDRLESRDSLSLRREPTSVDITSLYSHTNPFVIPNVSNLFEQNIASQRRHSTNLRTHSMSRQNSNPVLSALDDSESIMTNLPSTFEVEEEKSENSSIIDPHRTRSSSTLDSNKKHDLVKKPIVDLTKVES